MLESGNGTDILNHRQLLQEYLNDNASIPSIFVLVITGRYCHYAMSTGLNDYHVLGHVKR